MNLDLVEDTNVKQFSFDTERQNISTEKVITELRAITQDNKFIFQLHPKNFKKCMEVFEEILDEGNSFNNKLDIQSHSDGVDCNFCGESGSKYIDIPVALNIGSEDEIYPSVASSEVKVEMCESCMDEVVDEIERITRERKDILLAHEI